MKKPLNIIFCGTPECSTPILQALINSDTCTVQAVVTQPNRPVGRKKVLTAPPVKQVAVAHNIPVIQPEKLQLSDLEQYPCDFLVVVAFGQMLTQAVLDYPNVCAINVHPSLLPRWRGATPIQSSIAAGDTETGITIQRIVKKLDAGDILHQVCVPITATTTSTELFNTLFKQSAQNVLHVITNPLIPTIQDETQATYCTKLTREDGIVNPLNHTAEHIERLHRAYYPWPGITLLFPSQMIKVHQVSLQQSDESVPISCKNNTVLYATALQLPGEPIKPAKQVL